MTPEDSVGEEWRTIPGTEDYLASSEGRIKRITKASGAKQDRILRPWLSRAGPMVRLYTPFSSLIHPISRQASGRSRNVPISRLVCLAFHGERFGPYSVGFRDEDNSNVSAANLFWRFVVTKKAASAL